MSDMQWLLESLGKKQLALEPHSRLSIFICQDLWNFLSHLVNELFDLELDNLANFP